jgi:hypothetical protein
MSQGRIIREHVARIREAARAQDMGALERAGSQLEEIIGPAALDRLICRLAYEGAQVVLATAEEISQIAAEAGQ